MINYNSTYLGRLANWVSQTGHSIIGGGSTDIAMSAKTYWNAENGKRLFKILMVFVDFTFSVVDGDDHCLRSYRADMNEDYNLGQTIWLDFSIFFLQFFGCVFLNIVFLPVRLYKFVIHES